MTGPCRPRLLLVLAFLSGSCSQPPPRDGFTDPAIGNARQVLSISPAGTKLAHWDTLTLTMLERDDVVLATLGDIRMSLEPGKDGSGKDVCLATLTATITGSDWCTSTTYNQGLGQVLQVYLEKTGHALVFPWTLGALKIGAPGTSQALHYTKSLDVKVLDASLEAEFVVQPCLWSKCP